MLFAEISNTCNELPKPSNASGEMYCSEQCLMYSSVILAGRNASSPKLVIGLPSRYVWFIMSNRWNDPVYMFSIKLYSKCSESSVNLTTALGSGASSGRISSIRLCDRSRLRSCFNEAVAIYGIPLKMLSESESWMPKFCINSITIRNSKNPLPWIAWACHLEKCLHRSIQDYFHRDR